MPALFSGVTWGSGGVLEQTIALCDDNALTWALLERLPDVDRPEDVPAAELVLAAEKLPADARLSVVIPALDDEALVAAAIDSARAGGADEVLVADGGSRDRTREVAEAAGARVVSSQPGRAAQMNAGADAASGTILLFLHADTVLPPDAAALARQTLAVPGTVAGAFGFAVPGTARHSRLITTVGRWRTRLTGTPYGDQGLFMPASVFRALGGYPDLPTMEDLELVTRLKRMGRVEVLATPAETSARAWDRHGLVWTTVVNASAIAAYRLGADPDRVARWRQRAVGR